MDNLISERAKVSRDWENDFDKNLLICNSNPYDQDCNLYGYINFGTTENFLTENICEGKLSDIWICDFDLLGYKDYEEVTKRLRRAIAIFMTEYLESYEPISADNLVCLPGISSCIDVICHCLANPGEVLLVPTPMSGRTYKNCMQRSLVELFPIQVITEDNEDECPKLTIEKITCAYDTALKTGHIVRGVLLMNPHNPLGEIYSPKLLMDIMSFCSSKSLHLVVDEKYALSVFSESEQFHSILKFSQIPDPDRTHVVYGLSKVFGAAGLRIGVIHTTSKQLQKSLKQLSYFQTIPYPVTKIAAEFLEDRKWCQDHIQKYQNYLQNAEIHCSAYLRGIGIKVRRSAAGCFLWIDLRHLCKSSFDEERKLFNFFITYSHLYIGPGEEFFCPQPGWFRIVLTRNVYHLLEGFNRFRIALKQYSNS